MRWMVKKRIYTWDFPYTRNQLEQLVCKEFDCSEEELKGKEKKTKMIHARLAYVSIARYKLKDTTTSIGARLNKTHPTILYLMNRLADFEFVKHPLVKRIEGIEQKLFNQTTTI